MIEREDRDGVTILRMARGKVNALDVELLQALSTALDEAEASQAGAVVLTGAGPAFSAGVDLHRCTAGGPEYVRAFLTLLDAAIRRLFTFPRPTVAAVNGHAIAGGYILMAACDRRFMARGNGKVGTTELAVGVPFPPIALEVIRSASPNAARNLILSAKIVGAEEALAMSIVDGLSEAADLEEVAFKEAQRLASVPRRTYQLVKRNLIAPALEHAQRLDNEIGADVAKVWEAPDTLERMQGFLAQTVGRGK